MMLGDRVKLNSVGTVQPTDNPLEAIGEVTTVTSGGSAVNVNLYRYFGSGMAPTSVPPPIFYESAPLHSGILQTPLVDLLTQTRQWTVNVPLEEFRRMPNRRAFRQLLGKRLQAVYQEALAEWEKIRGEAEE